VKHKMTAEIYIFQYLKLIVVISLGESLHHIHPNLQTLDILDDPSIDSRIALHLKIYGPLPQEGLDIFYGSSCGVVQ
jgi:hypothetical protein